MTSVVLLTLTMSAHSQRGSGFGRSQPADRNEYPVWEINEFEQDVFTFVRIQYDLLSYRPVRQWGNDFPDREPRELPADHELFTMVYRLRGVPKVPSIRVWRRGMTFEYWHGDPEGDEDPHFWGFFDDSGRLMALFCQTMTSPTT